MSPAVVFVLVGGWPGSGKSTLSRALAAEMGLAWLSKDQVKESLMDGLGPPASVAESRALGATAVQVLLTVAAGCPGAVLDSTWFPATLPLVRGLPGDLVEVRCRVPVELARERYRDRIRHQGHLDHLRSDGELWGTEVPALGVGPLIEVDTSGPVDVRALAEAILAGIEQAKASR